MEFLIVVGVIIIGRLLIGYALELLTYVAAAAAIGYVAVAAAVGYVIAVLTEIPMAWSIGIAIVIGFGMGIRNMVE
jgi:hypothetical protein